MQFYSGKPTYVTFHLLLPGIYYSPPLTDRNYRRKSSYYVNTYITELDGNVKSKDIKRRNASADYPSYLVI